MISFQEIFLRLCAALLFGSVIGLERELDEQPAGMRTNGLVAMGCALFTLISAYGFLKFTSLPHVQLDPTRIASYIIAGIGFLGGGTIFVQKEPQKVKGLTTAAAIWVVASIGIACGVGMYWEAFLVTALTLMVLLVLRTVEHRFLGKGTKYRRLEIEVQSTTGDQFLSALYELCMRHDVKISDLQVRIQHDANTIVLACETNKETALLLVIEALRSYDGVRCVHTAFPGLR